MSQSIEFLLRLLDQDAPRVCAADLAGPHAGLLRACQRAGFLAREPDALDIPACVYCGDGSPYRVAGLLRCTRCRSRLTPEGQLSWRLDAAGFLGWLARRLDLRGGVRRVEPRLWHLGTWGKSGQAAECFYVRPGSLSPGGQSRLEAYLGVLVLHGLSRPDVPERPGLRRLPLPRLLGWEQGRLTARPLNEDGARREIRFDHQSGTLWAGGRNLGEVPLGSREYHLLGCLARWPDAYVGYGELRSEILGHTGGNDSRDAASFCHALKRRIKRDFIPDIDRVLTTNNKGAGYRLRTALDEEPHRERRPGCRLRPE